MMQQLLAHGGEPPPPPPPRRRLWAKLVGGLLVVGIGLGASVMSCIGQSFALRQARALEGTRDALQAISAAISARCTCPPQRVPETSR